MNMVGVLGQYVCQLQICGEDFINELKDIHFFNITFSAGIDIPKMEISFKTDPKRKLWQKIKENKPLKFYFGKERGDYIFEFYVRNMRVGMDMEYVKIYLSGYLKNPSYYFTTDIISFNNKSTVDVLKEYLPKCGFSVDLKYEPTCNNIQTWINPNQTQYSFLKHLIKHYNGSSTIATGFGLDGNLRLWCLDKLSKAKPKVEFVYGVEETQIQKLYNLDDTENKYEFGLMNAYGGYDLNIHDYNLLNDKNVKTDIKNQTKKLTPEIAKKFDFKTYKGTFYHSENISKDYYSSYFKNKKELASVNTSRLFIVTANKFIEASVLDIAKLNPPKLNEYFIGNYIINNINYTYQNKMFKTTFTIVRENYNML